MSQATPRHGLPYILPGQAQKEITHNEALSLLDAMTAASVLSADANTPPAAPLLGQCWIVGDSPSGEWSGHDGSLACWTDGGWRFLAARTGMRIWVEDQQLWAERSASAWRFGEVTAQRLIVGGVQVIGARLAAIAAPSGGAVQDVEVRAAVSALIERLSAHGLIDP